MDWKRIRLELGPTSEFPKGSASRVFLLRAPIDVAGHIDPQAIDRNPTHATVRRFWASERDESGKLERANGSWVFRPRGEDRDEGYTFTAGPFRADAHILVRQPDGTVLPFRIVAIESLGNLAGAKP